MQIVFDVKCVNDMHMISSLASGILIRFSVSYLISLAFKAALIMKLLILNFNGYFRAYQRAVTKRKNLYIQMMYRIMGML